MTTDNFRHFYRSWSSPDTKFDRRHYIPPVTLPPSAPLIYSDFCTQHVRSDSILYLHNIFVSWIESSFLPFRIVAQHISITAKALWIYYNCLITDKTFNHLSYSRSKSLSYRCHFSARIISNEGIKVIGNRIVLRSNATFDWWKIIILQNENAVLINEIWQVAERDQILISTLLQVLSPEFSGYV